MSDTFNMPKDFGELCEQYAFHDIKEIYTNGSELIQTYRVEQWIEMNGIEEALKSKRQNKRQAIIQASGYQYQRGCLKSLSL